MAIGGGSDGFSPLSTGGKMPKPKGATSLRLSEDALIMLRGLADSLGVSKTAVLEIAIREMAKREGIGAEPSPATLEATNTAHLTQPR